MARFEFHLDYNPAEVAQFFIDRNQGWHPEFISPKGAGLVDVDPDAALECIDGRFGKMLRRKKNGAKIPGGLNALALLKTGSDVVGFNAAAREAERLGLKAGTHRQCKLFELWEQGLLKSAQDHPLVLPQSCLKSLGNRWIKLQNKIWGGKHFYIDGPHEEEKVVFNGVLGMTPEARIERFSHDQWVLLEAGIHRRRAMELVAETVEQASPHCRRLEIVVP